jgi:hypothetical protein
MVLDEWGIYEEGRPLPALVLAKKEGHTMSRPKLKMTMVSSILLLSLWSTPAWSNPLYGRYLVSTDPGLVVLIVNRPQLGDALGAFWGDTLLAFSLRQASGEARWSTNLPAFTRSGKTPCETSIS